MTLKLNNKRSVVLALVAALAIAVAAVGYWTTTGSGTGTGTAGVDADNVAVVGTVSGLMTPGGPSRTVSFTASNPENFNQSISSITLTQVDAYPTAADRTAGTNEIAGCGGTNSASSDFQMAQVSVAPATDGDIAPGATAQTLDATGQLVMNNLDSNQDACKNAFLKLVFTTA